MAGPSSGARGFLNTSSLFSLYAEAAFSRKEIDQTLPAILFGGNEEANGLLTPKTDVFRGDP